MCRIDAWPRITHRHENACAVLLRASLINTSRGSASTEPIATAAFQVQDDLLQLNAIAVEMGNNPSERRALDRDAIFDLNRKVHK